MFSQATPRRTQEKTSGTQGTNLAEIWPTYLQSAYDNSANLLDKKSQTHGFVVKRVKKRMLF